MMSSDAGSDNVISFIRRRDYTLVTHLGSGACGETVLLHDDTIDAHFVCKKYSPAANLDRDAHFQNFIREVRLLYSLSHPNVVRIFAHYLYPDKCAGYIIMEFVDGKDIYDYIQEEPAKLNDVFVQVIAGFAYLQECNVLHRDIRPQNILVRNDGQVKIIDLGFGKKVSSSQDFEKSVSLNWYCTVPEDFADGKYDFCTEVYFVGKLFDRIIRDVNPAEFGYAGLVKQMCARDARDRPSSFVDIRKEIETKRINIVDFSDWEIETYRRFAQQLVDDIVRIDRNAKYNNDIARIRALLPEVYRKVMLAEQVQDSGDLIKCFISGSFQYAANGSMYIGTLRDFISMMTSISDAKAQIVLANLQSCLDRVTRIPPQPPHLPQPVEVPF